MHIIIFFSISFSFPELVRTLGVHNIRKRYVAHILSPLCSIMRRSLPCPSPYARELKQKHKHYSIRMWTMECALCSEQGTQLFFFLRFFASSRDSHSVARISLHRYFANHSHASINMEVSLAALRATGLFVCFWSVQNNMRIANVYVIIEYNNNNKINNCSRFKYNVNAKQC